MSLKRLVALLLVFVMVGSAVGPALAAGTEQKVPPCLSCSRKVVTIPKGLEVAELKGSSAYFKAIEVFNSKEALKLREHLKCMNLKPIYSKAIMQIVKYNGVSTEIVKIPLVSKKSGVLIYIKNRFGEATVIGIVNKTSNTVEIYYLKNGKIVEITKDIHSLSWLPDKCTICKEVVSKLCSSIANRGCLRACDGICTKLIEDPLAAAICEVVCVAVCELSTHWICSHSATAVCERVGLC